MGKNLYIGVGSKARKMKGGYVGVGGKARKIKKIYVGVGGKARLVYTSYVACTDMSITVSTAQGGKNTRTYTLTVTVTPTNATTMPVLTPRAEQSHWSATINSMAYVNGVLTAGITAKTSGYSSPDGNWYDSCKITHPDLPNKYALIRHSLDDDDKFKAGLKVVWVNG